MLQFEIIMSILNNVTVDTVVASESLHYLTVLVLG